MGVDCSGSRCGDYIGRLIGQTSLIDTLRDYWAWETGKVEPRFEADGVFYRIIDSEQRTVAVTYKGNSHDEFKDEYPAGEIMIPQTVKYRGREFTVTAFDKRSIQNAYISKIHIPQTVTTISDSAFYCCLLGDTIVIPKSVTYVGNGAFYPSQFDALVVEPGNPCYDSRDNCNALIETATNELIVGCKSTKFPRDLTAIRPSAFIGATELQDVDLPETLREIGQDAFVESGVREVVLPASIKELPRYAFQYCGNLNRITLNEGLRSIGVGALSHCAYRELIIPDSVEELADYACDWCVNLRTLTIGSGVRAIGIGAFSECKRLSKVVSRIPAENLFPVHNSAFSGIDEDCVLYVPRGAKDTYENTDGWNTFGEIREL